jgi:starvation-inducible DNA-binding protein
MKQLEQTTAYGIAGVPGVEPALRDRLIAGLNRNLATLTDLMVAYKQAHWNVVGRSFAQLHELFDRFADETRGYVDLVAERAVALGGVAHGTLQAATEQTALPPFPLEERDESHLLEALAEHTDRVAAELRQAVAASAAEAATQDLYIEVLRGLEGQRWMLLAHLAGAHPGGTADSGRKGPAA